MGLIVAALVAFGGFLTIFHVIIMVTLFTCVRADPNMALISPEMDWGLILICLGSAWILGYFQKDAFTYHTMGTKFYGRWQTDQGYIATKWITVGFPLLPIRSYIISYNIKEISNPEIELQRNAMQPFKGYFQFPQMLRTALISYGTIIWCLGCLWLIFISPCL
jgi:hypothetical protein